MNTVECSDNNCPICQAIAESSRIRLKNLKTDKEVVITNKEYDAILDVARAVITVSEEKGTFEANGGFVGITIPLTEDGKSAIFSIRKTVVEGKPSYEWLIEK